MKEDQVKMRTTDINVAKRISPGEARKINQASKS